MVSRSPDVETCSYAIVHTDLSNAPPFETVSYVWGSPESTHTINLHNGQVLHVTRSVAQALPHLVRACRTGYLWIDQIAINQTDLVERGKQVQIMGQIFGRSVRVLIWIDVYLTEGTVRRQNAEDNLLWSKPEGDAVRDLSCDVGTYIFALRERFNNAAQLQRAREHIDTKYGPKARRRLLWFLKHPWFTRMWMYQEFVLAPRKLFLIGDYEMSESDYQVAVSEFKMSSAAWLELLCSLLQEEWLQEPEPFTIPALRFRFTVDFAYSIALVAPDERASLRDTAAADSIPLRYIDELVRLMAASQCQDPRDHVFAFLSLYPSTVSNMRVDYSLSIGRVFARFTKVIIQRSKSTKMLQWLPSQANWEKVDFDLPTWTPDLASRPERSSTSFRNEFLFSASRRHRQRQSNGIWPYFPNDGEQLFDLSTSAHLTPNWNVLYVVGCSISEVAGTLGDHSIYQKIPHYQVDLSDDIADAPWQTSTLLQYMDELQSLNLQGSVGVNAGDILRVLLMDLAEWLDSYEMRVAEISQHVTVGNSLRWKVDVVVDALVNSGLEALPHGLTLQKLHDICVVQFERRLIRSTEGKLGLAIDRVQVGDKIALLHGSNFPILLRPREDGSFEAVGECFYDGVMYGEMAHLLFERPEVFKLV